ncbi:hypothetical protein AB1Y20_011155 [Prymnesium parvum]|uniref:CBM1 domain-containing protein n=1 Tax=Prymnesium parvum TaxID=97485 RepID=A0AB34IM24_PRYPA|mmetsp:Transcript_30760/g.64529  ORF Transcript_30760/g.64529 Transcript_30760/m.64529 type:complete len:232 (+) Transcript_30760:23-718(+)
MLAHLIVSVAFAADCVNKEFDQCGGQGFAGDTCCPLYDNCTTVNTFYSQCQPKDLCLVPEFGQCDGVDKTGKAWDPKKKCCPDSFHCEFQSKYYSQCKPNPPTPGKCAQAYEQCGGKDSDGNPWGTKDEEKTCCIPGYHCAVKDPVYYSGCDPDPICTNPRYGQCDGQDADGNPWTKDFGHDKCCPSGFKCVYESQYYSQCKLNTTKTAVKLVPGMHEVRAEVAEVVSTCR